MKTNERYLEALRYMNATMKNDIALGHHWEYCNVTAKKVRGFENKRKRGKYLANCVDGVQDALRIAGIPEAALAWYGSDGEIAWCSGSAKADARKYFSIISTGGKTVNQLLRSGFLCDGDILLGYQGMCHTNSYYGGTKTFDSGHAYCRGEYFRKWIGSVSHKNKKVNYILRLKDRACYRVQAGAFSDIAVYQQQAERLQKKGFQVAMICEDDMYKIQAGFFSGKTNADKLAARLARAGIAAYVKEV